LNSTFYWILLILVYLFFISGLDPEV